jgi:hypothetical protein
MTIKQHGGIFGRNPSFNDVSIETLSIAGTALSSTAAELNYLDGASTSAVVASKAVLANSSGNIAFPDSKGIDFSATAGTGTSELFDDYEEGTWTPSLGGDATYNEAVGHYTKVGNLVYIYCSLRPNVIGTGSTNTITGLPFAAAHTGSSLSISIWDFAANNAIVFTAHVQTSSLIVAAKATASANYVGVVPFADNGTRVRIGGVYRTS